MINTPFNYTGNKYKLLGEILPTFSRADIFVDVFTGGGSVYTNVLDRYETVIVNDIIEDLVLLHKNLPISYPKIRHALYSTYMIKNKDDFNRIRKLYNETSGDYIAFYSLLLSCTNNMMRFNNKFEFNQTYGHRFHNSSTDSKAYSWMSKVHPHLHKIQYRSLRFQRLYDTVKESSCMFYFDPPYGYTIGDGGFISNKQISGAGYNCYWKQSDDIDLISIVLDINQRGNKFVLSGLHQHANKTSWLMENLINLGFNAKAINHNYDKVAKNMTPKNSIELIIYN